MNGFPNMTEDKEKVMYQCPHCGEEMSEKDLISEVEKPEDVESMKEKKDKDRVTIAISMLKAPKKEIEEEKEEIKQGIHKA